MLITDEIREVVEKFQCSGCVHGCDTREYEEFRLVSGITAVSCESHVS